MHFLDAWKNLAPRDLLRLAFPVVILTVSLFLPGRRVARAAALLLGLSVLTLRELGPLTPLRLAWAALWGIVAWRVGGSRARREGPVLDHPGGIESGLVGLMLGLALLTLLIAAIARQDLSAGDSRSVSYGLLILCLGLLHLMLRRDARRAMVSFATLGLGLQVLDCAARAASLTAESVDRGTIVAVAAITIAIAARLAVIREHDAGSAWVSDAHDLHD
jgi:hypothetical protein